MFQNIFQIINQNIYGFLFLELQRKSSFSASYNIWKGVIDTMFQNIFQIIIQNIYGFLFSELQRTPWFSLKLKTFFAFLLNIQIKYYTIKP